MLLTSFAIIITKHKIMSVTRPFDSSPMLYYKWAIVTMRLFAPLSKYDASKIMGPHLDLLESRDAINHVTIRLLGVDFL